MSEPMSCDRVAELLPFFLNDSLSEEEREAVRGHFEACECCAEDLESARRVWRLHATHPAADDLVAYVFDSEVGGGDLDRETIEAHLSVCADCREQAELLAESRDLPPADRVVARPTFGRSSDQVDAADAPSTAWPLLAAAAALILATGLGAWGWLTVNSARDGWGAERAVLEERIDDLERRLDAGSNASDSAGSPALESGGSSAPEGAGSPAPVGTAELDELRSELARLRGRVAELSLPSFNVASVELFADGDVARSPSGVPAVAVPNRSQPVHLLLVAPEASASPADVRVRFLDAAGEEVWRGSGLRRQTAGEYSILVPAGLLPAGRVTLVLEEARQGDWTPVVSVPLDVGD